MLRELLQQRLAYTRDDGKRFFDAAQNARLVADAEGYYRALYYSAAASWNLRDSHMFSTLESLLDYYGPGSRAVVWAHNSHLGNAAATELALRGEHNIGQLCRLHYARGVYALGFGTDHGSVAAARAWGEPMERMRVRPAHDDSYERVCHEAGYPAFLLPLREPRRAALREELLEPRLERAIGGIYRPESELCSHYFYASLPQQFDEYVWFDESSALEALPLPDEDEGAAAAHPLGSPAVATV
jgi:protein-L-isoaspartate(D-aspartate) O-methyltransferase